MTREALLRKIQELSFAKDELILFLDTHKDSRKALEAFYRYREELREAVEEYEGKYGPLSHDGVMGEKYSYLDGGWPWYTGAEKEA